VWSRGRRISRIPRWFLGDGRGGSRLSVGVMRRSGVRWLHRSYVRRIFGVETIRAWRRRAAPIQIYRLAPPGIGGLYTGEQIFPLALVTSLSMGGITVGVLMERQHLGFGRLLSLAWWSGHDCDLLV
jgi:hypothetical protein